MFEKLEAKLPGALQKRGTALAVLAVLILASVFGIGGVKLRAAREAAANVYYERMEGELDARASVGQNLLTLAEKLPGGEGLAGKAEVEAALSQRELLQQEGPAAKSLADLTLEKAVNQLGEAMAEPAEAAGKTDMLNRQLAEFESHGRVFGSELEAYNEQAEACNKRLHSFPAMLIRLIWGIQEVELCV